MWVGGSKVEMCGWEVAGLECVVGGSRVGKCGWEVAGWKSVGER